MHARYWAMMIVAAIGWGTGGIATRAAFAEGADPWTLVTVRTLVAAALVAGLMMIQRRGIPNRQVLWIGTVMAIYNLVIPYLLFTYAYERASAGFVGLLAALIPIATAAFAHVMLPAEPLHRAKVLGLVIGFAGVAALLLSGDSGLSSGGRPGIAVLLSVMGVASIGYAGVYAKRHAGTYEPIDVTGLQFIIGGALLVVPAIIIEGSPSGITAAGWALIVYMAVAATFLPFYLFYRLIRHVSATTGSLIGYLVPLVALFGGMVLLDEQLQRGMVIGGVLILVGVILTNRSERIQPRAELRTGPP